MKSKLVYFCLTVPEHELKIIRKKAKETGISVSRFFRMAALGSDIKQPITVDIPILINEVRKAETALDRLLKSVEKTGTAEKEKTEEVLEKLLHAEEIIREAYVYKWQ